MEKVSKAYKDSSKFAELQLRLLQKERDEEIERTKDLLLASESQNFSHKKAADLERKGLGIKRLNIVEWTTSLFGKHLITLSKHSQNDLPATSITTGN